MWHVYYVKDSTNNQIGLRWKGRKNSKVGKPTLTHKWYFTVAKESPKNQKEGWN
jgi:hypothetical protein